MDPEQLCRSATASAGEGELAPRADLIGAQRLGIAVDVGRSISRRHNHAVDDDRPRG